MNLSKMFGLNGQINLIAEVAEEGVKGWIWVAKSQICFADDTIVVLFVLQKYLKITDKLGK